MEQYLVSARKYRPGTFASVVGQKALTATLKNAIASGRLAHAYLFCGSRGVGKTSCARIFAKTINCTNRTPEGEACNQCDSCRQFNENRSMNILELDAASHNGVDDIKSLTEQVMVPPTIGKYRVFIIDEVHMLTTAAFNAFLKTLEEPPAHAVFILATTEKHKIIPTILSRCQIYDFSRIGVADIVDHLRHLAARENIQADPAALTLVAKAADGGMRDALSIFDQLAAASRGNITYQAAIDNLNILDQSYYIRLTEAFIAQDVAAALLIYKEVRDKGFDSQFFINGLGQFLRDVMAASNPATISLVEAPDDVRQNLAAIGAKLHPTFLYRAMSLCNDADFNFRQASNKQFLIELTLIKLCQPLSPSSEIDGDDGGQLKPLPKGDTPLDFDLPQTPATNPAAAPAAASEKPLPAHTPAYTPGSMSLRAGAKTQPQAGNPSQPETPAKRLKPFTHEDLRQAWLDFIATRATEPLLTSSMGPEAPAPAAKGEFVLTLASHMQADQVENHKGEILQFLRNRLENDSFTFSIVVATEDLPPQYWPEKRVLEFMLEKHPAMADFIKKFKMKLS